MRRHIAFSAATLAATIIVLCAAAAGALADASPPTGTPTTTTTKPTSARPAKATISLSLPDVFVVRGKAVTVPGRPVSATGVIRPYVAGQWVVVKAFLGHRRLKAERLRIKPSKNKTTGLFTAHFRTPRVGILRIKVTHARTKQMLGFFAQRAVAALNEHAAYGSRTPLVSLVQHQLARLHIYVPQTGVYDQHTDLALDAYHRLLGWGVSQRLDRRTLNAMLSLRGAFHVRFPNDGKHVEGNLGKQLLALIYGSKVYRIYPISSGKPSTPTILGHFHVYSRVPGYLPDGMYYSDFFIRGYAIHGYSPAPDYPASHGCMRLPISDAISVYDWLAIGDVVDTYR